MMKISAYKEVFYAVKNDGSIVRKGRDADFMPKDVHFLRADKGIGKFSPLDTVKFAFTAESKASTVVRQVNAVKKSQTQEDAEKYLSSAEKNRELVEEATRQAREAASREEKGAAPDILDNLKNAVAAAGNAYARALQAVEEAQKIVAAFADPRGNGTPDPAGNGNTDPAGNGTPDPVGNPDSTEQAAKQLGLKKVTVVVTRWVSAEGEEFVALSGDKFMSVYPLTSVEGYTGRGEEPLTYKSPEEFEEICGKTSARVPTLQEIDEFYALRMSEERVRSLGAFRKVCSDQYFERQLCAENGTYRTHESEWTFLLPPCPVHVVSRKVLEVT